MVLAVRNPVNIFGHAFFGNAHVEDMMNKIAFDKIRALRSSESEPCVTLLMSRQPGADGPFQDASVVRKLMRDTERSLEKMRVPADVIQRMVATVWQVFDQDNRQLKNPYPGLAILLGPKSHHLFHTPFTLPDVAVCGWHFYIKPLLPMLTSVQRVAVLVLDQHHTRLVMLDGADPIACHELGFPAPAEEGLEQARHAGRAGHRSRGAAVAGIHGLGDIDKDALLLKRWRHVDAGVNDALEALKCPLVLAGVTYETALYRSINTYPVLVESALGGVVARGSAVTLARAALQAAETVLAAPEIHARERFDALRTTARASVSTPAIVRAAYQGKVDTLFLSRSLDTWGRFDSLKLTVNRDETQDSGGESMHSLAAEHTLLHSGNVFVLDADRMPNNAVMAAVLRQ